MFWLHFLGSSRVVHLYTQIMAQSHGDISDLNPEGQMNKVKIMLIAAGDVQIKSCQNVFGTSALQGDFVIEGRSLHAAAAAR